MPTIFLWLRKTAFELPVSFFVSPKGNSKFLTTFKVPFAMTQVNEKRTGSLNSIFSFRRKTVSTKVFALVWTSVCFAISAVANISSPCEQSLFYPLFNMESICTVIGSAYTGDSGILKCHRPCMHYVPFISVFLTRFSSGKKEFRHWTITSRNRYKWIERWPRK